MYYYKINTYGCQMNVHESEKIAGMLESLGYKETNEDSKADVIVFNTCAIRETAESHAIGNIGALKGLKKKKKNLIIAVGGCMTQQDNTAKKLKETFPFIDIIFGTHNLLYFKDYMQERLNTNKSVVKVFEKEEEIIEDKTVKRTSYPNAWVNIMYGCNNFCTYCIVPYVRGRERSRELNSILEEVESLVAEGYKEITLLGQNVDSYGKTLNPKISFATLLEKVAQIKGDFRLRFMSNHPKDIDDEVIKVVAKYDKICKSIHLPVQAGSDKILSLMNRRYTISSYLEIVEKIRNAIPNCAITTDIMVGFPNEDEVDFQGSVELLKKVQYDGAFTFVYSKRKGTKAYDMQGHISEEVKKQRIMQLVELQNNINKEKSKDYIDKVVEVLVENYDDKKHLYSGRDDRGRMIYFESDNALIGDLINIKIKKTGGISLFGEVFKG